MLKKSMIILTVFALVAIGCAGFKFVNTNEVTNVEAIEFSGLKTISSRELQVLMGIDLFSKWDDVNVSELEIKLMNHPKIETVQVSFGFDRVLNVHVTEAQVVASILDKSWSHLYSNGYLEKNVELPWSVPIVNTQNNLDSKVLKEVAKYLLQLKNVNHKVYKDLSMMNWKEKQVEFFFDSHQMKVLSLKEMNQATVWKKYELLTSEYISKFLDKKTLDLRFDGYAYAS